MLKGLIATSLLLYSGSSYAKAPTKRIYSQSTEKVSYAISKFNTQDNFTIAKIRYSPAQPKQGDKVTVLIELSTDFESNKRIKSGVTAVVGGQKLKLSRRAGTLWTSLPITVHQEGKLAVEVSGYLEDIEANKTLQESLLALQAEIAKLTAEHQRETDPVKKGQLQAVLESKLAQKVDLENMIEASKRPITQKTDTLLVLKQDAPNTTYPNLTGCVPDAGSVSGGTEVVLSGANLLGTTSLQIGETVIEESQMVVGDGEITFTMPGLSKGIYDIILNKQVAGQSVNTILHNAYYAGDISSVGSSGPVAFAGYPKTTTSEVGVMLDGSMSYGAPGETLFYDWSVQSRPVNADPAEGQITNGYGTATPTFMAITEGTYVVSLVVYSGTTQSKPSWTTVTIGPKAGISVVPSSIVGTFTKDKPYVGMFKICNNLEQDGDYQVYLKDIVLLIGSNRGTILRNSCLSFQFISYWKQDGLYSSIPVVMKTPQAFATKIDLSLYSGSEPTLTMHTVYNEHQWMGETNVEMIANSGVVPVNGVYDEDSLTKFELRNRSSLEIYVSTPPDFTYIDGTSGVFEMDMGSGVVVPAEGSADVYLKVKQNGNFGVRNSSSAMLTWNFSSLANNSVSTVVETQKLPSLYNPSKLLDFGDVEEGATSAPLVINIMQDFYSLSTGQWLTEVEDVDADLQGCFEADGEFWPGFPFSVGNNDKISSSSIDIRTYFKPYIDGLCEGSLAFKLRGYQTPILYPLKGNGIIP
ncbi:IPT/TIG domain-containing protein [Bdellovibrio bacteriovorus]|nr:IPT/TIG domain-containing protein [Bdellovibrio bacteriovorus]